MNTYSYRQKISPSKDLKLLSQDWVFVKKSQYTEYPQCSNTIGFNSTQTDHNPNNYQNQRSISDLHVLERSTAIPFCNGQQQTFYSGIRDSSIDYIMSNKNQQEYSSIDHFNLTSIMGSLPPPSHARNKQFFVNTQQNPTISSSACGGSSGCGNSFLPKSPYKNRVVKSSRDSSEKSSIVNSIRKFLGKESKLGNSQIKHLKMLNQTVDFVNGDTSYDVKDETHMLQSISYLPQNSSTSTFQVASSSDKKSQRRSSIFKNSNRKLKLQNNLSSSFIVNSNISGGADSTLNIKQKTNQSKIQENILPLKEQNEIQKWSEQTAIFAEEQGFYTGINTIEKLPQSQLSQQKESRNEVQAIIDGLFQEIEERDKDRTIEQEVMRKYKKQHMERLAKSSNDKQIQRVNNTNIVLNYSRGNNIQSNANGFQMSKYLYDQKYGRYKCIPQNFNIEVIPNEDQKLSLMLNKPDYTVKELTDIPIKSIFNQEIDETKKYQAATRVSEREQIQLKVPASTMMKKVLDKYDHDSKFIVSSVEQQDSQNIIQEVYGDYLQNPAKRLNISKIKQNQMMQNNVYDSRYVKPFIIEEENLSEGNMFTNNSRNTENHSPHHKKQKEIASFSKFYKQQQQQPLESQRNSSPLQEINPQSPRTSSGFSSPISVSQNRVALVNQQTSTNQYNFSNFIVPQKSFLQSQTSNIYQQTPQGRNTPLRFKRNPYDNNLNSPTAPASRLQPIKKKKIQIKTNINEIGSINEARISTPFVKISDCERGMKQNVSSERQKFYDSWYSPPHERQKNLDRHLNKYQDNIQYEKKLVQKYILLKSNGEKEQLPNKIKNVSLHL